MKKTLGLLALLIVLLGAAFLAFKGEENTSSLDLYDRSFNIENSEDLGRIVISRKNRPTVQLKREGSRWKVNDKFLVGESEIKSLTDVLKQMRLKYIPHPNAIPNIINEMGVIGVKVELYDRKNALTKSFYVGGGTSDERGTYLLMDGADQPYVMDMAKYEGSIRGRFLLSEQEWRDRTFLSEKESDIKKVIVEYPKEKDKSFVLDVENNQIGPRFKYSLKEQKEPKKGAVKAYLRNFAKIGAEFIENDNKHRDSLSQTEPFCVLTLDFYSKDKKEIRFFPVANPLLRKPEGLRHEDLKNVERYLADCVGGDFYLVQQLLVGKLFATYDFF